jgi:hypothetical protein
VPKHGHRIALLKIVNAPIIFLKRFQRLKGAAPKRRSGISERICGKNPQPSLDWGFLERREDKK